MPDAQEGETKKVELKLTPKQIRSNIEAGEKWVKGGPYKGSDARWKQWEKNKKHLMCIWEDATDDSVNYNSIFSNQNTIRPTLYFKNPKIRATPARPQFMRDQTGNVIRDPNTNIPKISDNYQAAHLFGLKINHEIKEIKFKQTLKDVLSDCLCPYGIGWIKWGYSDLTVSAEDNDRNTQVEIWGKRVDPRNIVYHWMGTEMDSLPFIAERLVMTRERAKELGFKIPEIYKSVFPDFLKSRDDKVKNSLENREDDLIIIWEYHHLEENMLYWVLDKHPDDEAYPKDPVDNPYPFDGSCYVPLVLNKDNDDIIGLSDAEPVEDQAKAINRLRTKQIRHVDKFGTVVWYEDQAILPNDLNNHVTTDHAVYVKLQPGGIGKIKVEGTPAMGQDNYAMVNEMKEDMRTSLGITEYQQGSSGSSSTTATVGSIVANSAIVRIDERKDIIKDFVIENVRRLAALIQTYSNEQDFINVADEDLDEDFVDYAKQKSGFNPKIPFLYMSKKDIQGEYNFDFSVDDMVQVPKEVQLQQLNGLMQAFMATPQGLQALQDNDISMSKIVKKAFELAGVDMNEIKYGGPKQFSSVQENEMFKAGMEVPEPHRRDKDDEHITTHSMLLNMLQSQSDALMQQITGLQKQAANIAPLAHPDVAQIAPNTANQANQMLPVHQDQIQQLTQAGQNLTDIIRRIKLHLQEHEAQRMQKDESEQRRPWMPQAPSAPQGVPTPTISAQGPQPQGAGAIQAQIQGQANAQSSRF